MILDGFFAGQRFKELQSYIVFLPTYTDNYRSCFCLEPNTSAVEVRGYQGSEVCAPGNDILIIFFYILPTQGPDFVS